MDDKKQDQGQKPNPETVTELKEQTHAKDEVKKGYNEKNPTQPQGAFIPDSEAKGN